MRRGARTGRLALLVTGLVGLLTTGCAGYTTKRIDAFPSARTIAIQPVVNEGYRRDLELRLGHALADEIRARTSYALTNPGQADLVIETRMTAEEEILVQGQDREAVQRVLAGTVHVRVLDRQGRVLRTDTITAQDEFLTARYGESLEGSATDTWTRRMAIRIVQVLEAGF